MGEFGELATVRFDLGKVDIANRKIVLFRLPSAIKVPNSPVRSKMLMFTLFATLRSTATRMIT